MMRGKSDYWLQGPQSKRALGALLLIAAGLFMLSRGLNHAEAANRLEGGRAPEAVRRVSLNRLGAEGNSDSFAPSVSGDGRYVAFVSTASNLVPDDNNWQQDVFVYDRQEDEIERISTGYDGAEADGRSESPRISADGRYVTFVSHASNLVADDRNGVEDVFLYERLSNSTIRVSVGPGRREGSDRSLQPSISADGRFVAFVTLAENLMPGDKNGMSDVFVHDRATGELELITVGNDGQQADFTSKYPSISADGRFVAFQTMASNLAPGDDNNSYDIFVRDRHLQVTELLSHTPSGKVGNHESRLPSISDQGRFVAFESWADDLVEGDDNDYSDVFVVDRQTGAVELVSVDNQGQQASDINGAASVSSDGSFVAFVSRANNLSPQDDNAVYDVYLRDRRAQETRLISVSRDGRSGDGASISPSLTTSGTYIVFDSLATDLVADDTNGRLDVFVFDSFAGVEFTHTVHLPLVMQP